MIDEKKSITNNILVKLAYAYKHHPKKLLIVPITLLILAFFIIFSHYQSTGDFINRDVTLKGGVTVKISGLTDIPLAEIEQEILAKFSDGDVNVRALSSLGQQTGVIIDSSDIDQDTLQQFLMQTYRLSKDEIEVNFLGSSLGASFFTETLKALIMAFLFMGAVVYLYFGPDWKSKFLTTSLSLIASYIVFHATTLLTYLLTVALLLYIFYIYYQKSVPSLAVLLAAFSDIVCTWAVTLLLGMKLSIAGVAAFLMLIGYSVDTDILLTTRVLKRKGKELYTVMIGAMKTGLIMSVTAITAVIIAYLFTSAPTIKQIMAILFIGLVFDIINTYLQNAPLLAMFVEREKK